MGILVHKINDSNTDSVSNHEFMLSTIDNPYDPFTHYDLWYAFDQTKGYKTCEYLARIAKTSDDLSDLDNAIAIETAIDEIVDINVLGLYIKVGRDTFKNRMKAR